MQDVFKTGEELLKKGISFVYTAVISKKGSAPSDLGSRMLVLKDRTVGTIGGGAVEADVIDYSRKYTLSDRKSALRSYNLNQDNPDVFDALCGGTTEVIICYMDAADEENIRLMEAAASAFEESKSSWLVYGIDMNPEAESVCQIGLGVENEGVFGRFEDGASFKRDMIMNPVRMAVHEAANLEEGRRYIVDKINTGGIMYLMGGGHVSLEVAKLAVGLDFNVTVIDDREEFANTERFPGCNCIVVDDFRNIPDLPVNSNTYILVITRGHAGDRWALEWALDKGAKYLGMIGSKSKRDKIYEMLLAEGASQAQIDAVHCPIGLSIGAKSPAEIGISIMAEIISVRHGRCI